jgi:hypothetical protein
MTFSGSAVATGTFNTSGDHSVIAAPSDPTDSIIITEFVVQNESSTPNTILLKDGSTAIFRVLAQNQGDGLIRMANGRPSTDWVITAGNAFQLNLSASSAVGYSFRYYVGKYQR